MSDFLQLLSEQALWPLIGLIFIGTVAFIISTLSGGGGALILVPILNWLIGVTNTAPVLNLGTFLGRPARLIIFWKHINWKVCLYYAPAALVGATMAGWLFKAASLSYLQIFVALFLITTIFQFRWGKKQKAFNFHLAYFIPLELVVSMLGTLIGALGPVLNPFYLSAGLDKEELIATKTANSFLMGIAQIGSYTFFGLLDGQNFMWGLCLGLGATLGTLIGKRYLKQMKSQQFRKLVIAVMVISGMVMLFRVLSQW